VSPSRFENVEKEERTRSSRGANSSFASDLRRLPGAGIPRL
jgi:hypothetical protein